MTPKQRVYAALEGKKLDNYPVMAAYSFLSNVDRWTELTGLPVWKFYEWTICKDAAKHGEMYKMFYETLPFDIVQPWGVHAGENMFSTSGEYRDNTEIIFKDDIPYFHYKKEDTYEKVPDVIHELASGGGECKRRVIYDINDAREKIKVRSAEERIEVGANLYIDEMVRLYGKERFIISGGLVNTFYSNVYYLGMTNFFTMLYEEPELIKYMSERILEQNIQIIRSHAAAGGDAIYIDDATATCDMVSPKIYEEFSLPYMIEEVKEIHRLGKKAVLIYFGGISDRVDMIAETGADLLIMEASMKTYKNDYEYVSKKLNGKMALAGNLNPYEDLEITTDEEFEKVMEKAVGLGRKYGKYLSSTGSPITPGTSINRIKRFIELGHKL